MQTLLLLSFLLLLLALVESRRDFYARHSNSARNYDTIQDCVDAATNHIEMTGEDARCVVMPGTYHEELTIHRPQSTSQFSLVGSSTSQRPRLTGAAAVPVRYKVTPSERLCAFCLLLYACSLHAHVLLLLCSVLLNVQYCLLAYSFKAELWKVHSGAVYSAILPPALRPEWSKPLQQVFVGGDLMAFEARWPNANATSISSPQSWAITTNSSAPVRAVCTHSVGLQVAEPGYGGTRGDVIRWCPWKEQRHPRVNWKLQSTSRI